MDTNTKAITETFSKTYNDISTIYAYLENPEEHRKCDVFSCFSNHYKTGKEREFIKELEAKDSSRYSSYLISWCDSN